VGWDSGVLVESSGFDLALLVMMISASPKAMKRFWRSRCMVLQNTPAGY
jgi:hypothetical protein